VYIVSRAYFPIVNLHTKDHGTNPYSLESCYAELNGIAGHVPGLPKGSK